MARTKIVALATGQSRSKRNQQEGPWDTENERRIELGR